MAQLVKVCKNAFYTIMFYNPLYIVIKFDSHLMCVSYTSNQFSFENSDIDECSADPSPCDADADCTNSEGSYSCTCKQGFAGDGTSCQGTGKLYL